MVDIILAGGFGKLGQAIQLGLKNTDYRIVGILSGHQHESTYQYGQHERQSMSKLIFFWMSAHQKQFLIMQSGRLHMICCLLLVQLGLVISRLIRSDKQQHVAF